MFFNVMAVGIGGFIGSAFRYLTGFLFSNHNFPVHTLFVNVLGAIFIGFITGIAEKEGFETESSVLFWKTGICGGFTTFSTFALESTGLFTEGRTIEAAVYIVISVLLCIVGVMLGKYISELI